MLGPNLASIFADFVVLAGFSSIFRNAPMFLGKTRQSDFKEYMPLELGIHVRRF